MQNNTLVVFKAMKKITFAFLCAIACLCLYTFDASAHQPYFEETDLTYESPYAIREPDVSVAYYATLSSADDVDYYVIG